MNRRQKIIVSVTGIFIVLLILVGLTYAYFLTQIRGNENDKSISVTTANLALVYSDGTDIVLTSEDKLIPGEFTKSKTFTVENTGNATVENYAVVIEDVVNPLDRPEDMEMTLTCTSNIEGKTCDGTSGSLPNQNEILVHNSIDEGEIQTYTLTLTYVDPGVDQSSDMGKTIEGKLNIMDTHNTIDVTGTVATVSEGDYVQVNSEPRVSQIGEDKTFKVVGLEPGTHTIAVYGSDGVAKGSSTFTLTKSSEESVSGTTIKFNDGSRSVTMDINSDYTISVSENIKRYLKNTIINNSQIALNGTKYVKTPPSKVAEEESLLEWENGTEAYVYITEIDLNGAIYSDSSQEIINCIVDEECDNVNYNPNSCETVKGKYISSRKYYEEVSDTIYVSDCINGMPITEIDKSEKVLSITEDDYGTSYYYRGNVQDNYLSFAGKLWRIVRIQGDGSIKLILNEDIGGGNYGYEVYNDRNIMNYLKPTEKATKSMVKAFYDFQQIFTSEQLSKLKSGGWCLNDSRYASLNSNSLIYPSNTISTGFYNNFSSLYEVYDYYINNGLSLFYNSLVRLSPYSDSAYAPTLKCQGTILTEYEDVTVDGTVITKKSPMYVGTVTADEVVFAGNSDRSSGVNTYLYLLGSKWTLSPSGFSYTKGYGDSIYIEDYSNRGTMSSVFLSTSNTFYPSIILKNGTIISGGDGTKIDPYVVE